jgi:hypothetical protein
MMTEQDSDKPLVLWHRLFGILLTDFLEGSPFKVELEYDLSQHKQLLDIIVVRKEPGELTIVMPDGLDDLVDHNLISFKSYQETLDDWTLKELTGHYVNYRKQTAVDGRLQPEEHYHLYAICARSPRELLKSLQYRERHPGVYDIIRGTDTIRVVVAGELALEEQNALLHLFSAAYQRIEYGKETFRLKSKKTSTTVDAIVGSLARGGIAMPYTVDDFQRDLVREAPAKVRLEGLSAHDILSSIAAQELLAAMSKRDINAFLKQKSSQGAKSSRKKSRKKKD